MRPMGGLQAFGTLGDALEYWAQLQPEHPALFDERGTLSYGDLATMARATGRGLRAKGITAAGRVALVSASAAATARALVAIACNCTCAPLDPALGADDLEILLRRIGAAAVMTDGHEAAAEAARRLGLTLLAMPDIQVPHGEDDAAALAGRPQPGDVALIICSSGTTGRPKLVPLNHGALCLDADYAFQSMRMGRGEHCINPMPLFHALGMKAGLVLPVCSGGTASCIAPFDAALFAQWCMKTQATWYVGTPLVHAEVLRILTAAPQAFAGWAPRVIRCGSAALPPATHDGLVAALGAKFYCTYGSSEVANIGEWCSADLDRPFGSVGRVVAEALAILSPELLPLPPGAMGEIAVRGAKVFRGYIDDEEANANAFTPDGWFRTGDLGRLDADGFLYVEGRVGTLINRGGAKVSPQEVEAWLMAQPGIAHAAVFAVPHAVLGEDVAAAVVSASGGPIPDPRALRAAMLDGMPGYKVPSRIALVPELPLGPAGKVRRAGLAETLAAALRPAHRAPVTAMEQRAVAAFAAALRVPVAGIGMDEDFFSLGGHSLLAVQMLAQASGPDGPGVAPGAFMRDPTPAGLALLLAGRGARRWPDDVEAYRAEGERAPLFFMPGFDGHPHAARGLLEHLPSRVPLLGVAPPPGWEAAADQVGMIAQHCAAVMRAALPDGPYRLVGHSFGGNVAHATARLLAEAGGEVALLCLLDPDPLLEAPERGQQSGVSMRSWAVFQGPAVLMRAWQRPLRHLAMPGLGWEHLCAGGVAVYDIATTHWGLMAPPHLAKVGALLAAHLDGQDGPGAKRPIPDIDLPFRPVPETLLRARGLLGEGRPAEAWAALRDSPAASLPVWALDLAELALARATPEQERPAAMHALEPALAPSWAGTPALIPREMRLGRHAMGLALMDGAPPPGTRPETLALAEALCAHRTGQARRALMALARLGDLIASEPDVAAVAFYELADGGWPAAAMQHAQRALAAGSGPARVWIHGLLASLAADQGDWLKVAAEAGAAAAAWPGFFNYQPLLVLALVRLGRQAEAVQRHAEASAGHLPDAILRLALDRALAGGA